MQINRFIHEVLKERKLSTHDLYTLLVHALPKEVLPLSYNTFLSQFTQNKLSAIELIQIAAVLNINLNELVEIQKFFLNKNIPNLNTRLDQRLKHIFQLTEHKRDEAYPYYIFEIGTDCYHFMSPGMDEQGAPRILIEEFNFNDEKISLIGNSHFCRGDIPEEIIADQSFYTHENYEALKKETGLYYTLMPVERKFRRTHTQQYATQSNEVDILSHYRHRKSLNDSEEMVCG